MADESIDVSPRSFHNCVCCRERRLKCVGDWDWPSSLCDQCTIFNRNNPRKPQLECSPRQSKNGSEASAGEVHVGSAGRPHNNHAGARGSSYRELRPEWFGDSNQALSVSTWAASAHVINNLPGSANEYAEPFTRGQQIGPFVHAPLPEDHYIQLCLKQQQLLDFADYLRSRRLAYRDFAISEARTQFEQNLCDLEDSITGQLHEQQRRIDLCDLAAESKRDTKSDLWPRNLGRRQNFRRLLQINGDDGIASLHGMSKLEQFCLEASEVKARELWVKVQELDKCHRSSLAHQECLELSRFGKVRFLEQQVVILRLVNAFKSIAKQFATIWTDMQVPNDRHPNPEAGSEMFSHLHLMLLFGLGRIALKEACNYSQVMTDPLQRTVLHAACELRHVSLTQEFMTIFARDKKSREACDIQRLTPVFIAVQANNAAAVEALKRHRANLDVRNSHHKTPLTLACAMGYHDIASMLLKAGCHVHGGSDDVENSPLYAAVANNRISVVSLLLSYNALPSPTAGTADWLPQLKKSRQLIDMADRRGHQEIRWLLGEMHRWDFPMKSSTKSSSDADSTSPVIPQLVSQPAISPNQHPFHMTEGPQSLLQFTRSESPRDMFTLAMPAASATIQASSIDLQFQGGVANPWDQDLSQPATVEDSHLADFNMEAISYSKASSVSMGDIDSFVDSFSLNHAAMEEVTYRAQGFDRFQVIQPFPLPCQYGPWLSGAHPDAIVEDFSPSMMMNLVQASETLLPGDSVRRGTVWDINPWSPSQGPIIGTSNKCSD